MDTYSYALELIAEDGRTLGQVPAEPDWEPVLECAAFAALRRGLLPAVASAPAGRIEPLWDEARGRPFVSGFRVHIAGAPADDLPVSYLWAQARAASAAFVASGTLQPGASFWYRVRAVETGPAPAAEDDLGFAVEEVATALPVGEGSLPAFLSRARRSGPQPDADELAVFIPRAVLEESIAQARAHPDVETGGVLVGRLRRDPELRDLFLEVTGRVAAEHTVSDATKLTFTAETWAAAEAAVARRRRGEQMCGWVHSHPCWCRHCPLENQRRCTRSNAFLSTEDLHLTRVCFGRAHNLALLISDSVHTGMTWTLYGWDRGVVTQRGFHIIESNEEQP